MEINYRGFMLSRNVLYNIVDNSNNNNNTNLLLLVLQINPLYEYTSIIPIEMAMIFYTHKRNTCFYPTVKICIFFFLSIHTTKRNSYEMHMKKKIL